MRNKLTDQALWEAFRQHDEKAFTALFDRYWSQLFTTAFYYIKDREVCSDIVHDIFLNLWQKREQLEVRSLKNYLTAAARYHTYRHLRNAAASPLQYDPAPEEADRKQVMNHGEEKIQVAELKDIINNHLHRLPDRCREIFILSRIEHLSNDEIAARLHISKRTVENQLTTALRHLRGALKTLCLVIILLTVL